MGSVFLAALAAVSASPASAFTSAIVHRVYNEPLPVQPAAVRPWAAQPYFGTVIDGVALGKLIDISDAPPSPARNVCWFWATDDKKQGYWDYCQPPA